MTSILPRLKRTARILAILALPLVAIRLWPHEPLLAHVASSTAVVDRNGKLLRLALSSDDKYRLPVTIDEVSPELVEAILLKEDRWYRWHLGFNPWSLLRGAYTSYLADGPKIGGSTITMQLARLRYGLNTRTPSGKLEQVVRAFALELGYGKREILEAYLNIAPYGRNIEGVGAASLVYFDKSAAKLSLPEALALAVIPQDPSRRSGFVATLRDARTRLTADWLAAHPGDAARASLLELPLTLDSPERLPFEAPHFVDGVLQQARIDPVRTARIETTLDLELQRLVERQLKAAVRRGDVRGIRNAAALLVDTRDMGVRAQVGSANYFDEAISGQVDVTMGKRSPGSTLKPFIYALALDQGVLHPLTVLRDVPTSFGPYTPENFDSRFLGPVTATEALVRSRNIPAVDVAAKLDRPTLYEFLHNAGVSRMLSAEHYGLALVLGGGEVTSSELARLYSLLANGGELRGLRRRAQEPNAPGPRLVSEEAAWLTLDMLRQNPRPDEAASLERARFPVSWKTGTSYGFRDAWSAGVFGPYVLVVWVGNADGAGNPAFVGVEAAAPLFFSIVDAVRARDPAVIATQRIPPRGLARVEICLASGGLPNAWCPERGLSWFIPGKSPIRMSDVHRPVWVDAQGAAVCGPAEDGSAHQEVYEFWPSDLAQVFSRAGIPRRKPPRADCRLGAAGSGQAPRLTSPLKGTVYTLRAQSHGEDRIAFNAIADADVAQLYWFVDDAYVGAAPPGHSLFWNASLGGSHNVRVVDDHGRADSRELRIAAVE